MVKYSLVIPLFNKSDFILRCLESVPASLSGGPSEIVVVDDGSRDGSLEIVRGFSDSRIRILQRNSPGAGGYAARNLGIQRAVHEWVAFLDADDIWLPQRGFLFSEAIEAYPEVSFLSCGWIRDWGDRSEDDPHFRRFGGDGFQLLSISDYLQRSVNGFPAVHTNTVMAKKALLIDAGLFPESERRGGDSDLWLRAIHQAEGMGYVSCLGARYYLSLPGAVTTSNNAIFSEHPVRKTAMVLLGRKDGFVKKGILKRYSDSKTMDWMREQIRRKCVRFTCFRFLFYPFSLKSFKILIKYLLVKVGHQGGKK